VATVDMFGSPALFKKLETKLLHSYLTEAIDIRARPNIKPPTADQVKAFMSDADKAAESKSYDTGAADTMVQRGERALKAKDGYKKAPPAAVKPDSQPSPAADEPTVYENYQAK